MAMSRRKWLGVAAGVVIATAAVGTSVLFGGDLARGKLGGAAPSEQSLDFSLRSARGTLSLASLRGHVVLVYFGYTSCPDVCPTTLARISHASAQLDGAQREQVRVLFVSVDPARDTLAHLEQYAGYFGDNVVGATASPGELMGITALFGARFRHGPTDARGHYSVDHSGEVFVLDRQGRLVATLPHGASSARVAESIRAALSPGRAPGRSTHEANSNCHAQGLACTQPRESAPADLASKR